MSIQPVITPRVSSRVGKKSNAPKSHSPARKNTSDVAIEDDDWVPLVVKLPARVVSEFIDNDYDMM